MALARISQVPEVSQVGGEEAQYYAIHHRRRVAGGSDKKIHLHQSSYEQLTRERDSDPWALCFNCHRNVHRANETGRFRDLEAAIGRLVTKPLVHYGSRS